VSTQTDTPESDIPPTDASESVDPSSSADTPTSADVIMTVTDQALETVLGIRAEEENPDGLALRVGVTGAKGVEYTYDLSFEDLSEVEADHVQYRVGDLVVAIPNESIELMVGAELDLPKTPGQGGLVIRNPNRPNPLRGPDIDLELTGTVEEKVTQLLEQSVNPMLASHGGFATLERVEDDSIVFVTMGGGCQGCAVSAQTLRDGIQRAILEAIPEVTEVRDTTDHDAGENPFYTENPFDT
jgi:Fe/S biogenesis protein NfuA